MSVAGRNAPLSPVSVGGSEWSFSKYQSRDQSPGLHPGSRGNLASPPNSGGSNGTMSMNGFPSGPRSNGGPSPPPSIGRSSNGTNLYSRSDSGSNLNGPRGDMDEAILGEHYVTLRTFLNTRDPNNKQQPNKARDKLLRLSSVQFYELSTDVYDELIRRQSAARAPPNAPNGPPSFLLPEKAFHPKRNQARQRLSSLGPPRFRDLAADVFHELERRFPRFVGGDIPRGNSSMSNRPPGRTGTPGSGGFPPRGQSRMRRPSDASSIRGPPPPDAYGMPPSPNLPNGDFGRPMPKQLNQNNTIVPNKSTMMEEDDGGADDDAFGLERVTSRQSKGMGGTSETDKKLIDDYQTQVRELREKLEEMEDAMKKKDDELINALDDERSRATAVNVEKSEWAGLRSSLEGKLTEAQNLNSSMKQELDRIRDEHDQETRQLRDELNSGNADENLQRENDELRNSLRQQQQLTDEVRQEAQGFMREMRVLSQQSSAVYEKQAELERTIEQLEHETRDWRSRYARTKTQLRNMRASSMGLTMDQDASKYVRDKGFTDDQGLIKDVHVTKFQIAIEELLQKARQEEPEKVTDAMKLVVVSVRRVTRDVDESTPNDDEVLQQQGKLKAKVSSTANGLITASKNFVAGAGISPVSLLDAAASHLTAAVVELLRVVKIRATPAGELEEDDDGSITPVDSTGFFSPRSTTQASSSQGTLPPPPPFQGLGGVRASAESSAYSPISSPRESMDPYARNGANSYLGMNQGHSAASSTYGMQRDSRAEDLKIFLDDQTALLVSDIQNLVGCIRGDADIRQITASVEAINAIIGQVVSETQTSGYGNLVVRLGSCRERLLEASQRGQEMANSGVETGDSDWRMWTQTLPPISFEIARETKELAQRVGKLAMPGGGDDDFS